MVCLGIDVLLYVELYLIHDIFNGEYCRLKKKSDILKLFEKSIFIKYHVPLLCFTKLLEDTYFHYVSSSFILLKI